jgi:hypothetical protein
MQGIATSRRLNGVRWGGCRYEPVSKKLFGVVMLRDLQPGTEAELVKVRMYTYTKRWLSALLCPSHSAPSFHALTWLSHLIFFRA